MIAHELKIAKEALISMESHGILEGEQRDNLNFLSIGFSKTISGIKEVMEKISHIPTGVFVSAQQQAVKNVEKNTYSTLNKYMIRMPEGVSGEMIPWLEALSDASKSLKDIESRLIKPLKLWVGRSISYPGEIEKLWLDNSIAFAPVEKHCTALSKIYSDKVGDSLSFALIHDAYPKPKDFKEAGILVNELTEFSTDMLGKNLIKQCEEISSLVKRLIDENDRADLMKKAPKSSIIRLAETLHETAEEIEFLSVLLFQIRIASVAYSESIEKINKEL